MKRLIYFLVTSTLLFSALSSCRARVDIDTSAAEPRLIIFGRISSDSTRHEVQITESIPYFSTNEPPAISGAVVTITDGMSTFPLAECDTLPGVYRSDSTVCGVEGRTYTLDIMVDYDGDGVAEHYQASSQMPYGPRVDSIALSPLVFNNIPMMLAYGHIPTDQSNYLCLYNGKNNEPKGLFDYYAIMSDNFFVPSGNAYIFPFFIRGGIAVGDTINFRVESFTQGYAQFLSQASSEMSASNPFFSSPPAEVVTNITCLNADVRVSGFFAAYFRGRDLSLISDRDLRMGNDDE